MESSTRPTHAHVHLVRLCGYNYREIVEYRGKSVFVRHFGRTYRLDAAKFCAGTLQMRDEIGFSPWDFDTAAITMREAGWQT